MVNPFAENIVKDPRRVESPVTGLNDRQLEKLLDIFGVLESNHSTPRMDQLSHAILVTSSEPGYGKSHLIGRFLRHLDRRATKIYIKPFQNPSLCWQAILLRTVQELNFPDRSDVEFGQPGEPTQLDSFAFGILAQLTADYIKGGGLPDVQAAEVAKYLCEDPVDAFGFADDQHQWANWMRAGFEGLLPHFEKQLGNNRVDLAPSASAWIRVLFRYAFFPTDFELRKLCLSWLKGESLDIGEGQRLGLKPRELARYDLPTDELNDLCKTRLFDFCQLAGFYRPFVFCFDQTEVYGHKPALARCFGMAISELVRHSVNLMLVVTANLDPWLKAIKPYMERADQDCFHTPHLSLEGLNRAQGEELIKSRLKRWEVPDELAAAFMENDWLLEKFPSEQNRFGTRHFLQLCQKQWDHLHQEEETKAEKKEDETDRLSLEDFYERYRKDLLEKPKRLLFDPDTLLWLIQEAAKSVPGLAIEPHPSENIVLAWQVGNQQTLFGLESGSHWKRWQIIARDAMERFAKSGSKTVFFRTPDLTPIPGRWKIAEEIETAKRTCLQIVNLTKEDVAELYAARELYAEAVQGNIPASGDEVLVFLSKQLEPWWEQLKH